MVRPDDEELDPRLLGGCGGGNVVEGGTICWLGQSGMFEFRYHLLYERWARVESQTPVAGRSTWHWSRGYGGNLAPRLWRCARLFQRHVHLDIVTGNQNLVPIGLQDFCVELWGIKSWQNHSKRWVYHHSVVALEANVV